MDSDNSDSSGDFSPHDRHVLVSNGGKVRLEVGKSSRPKKKVQLATNRRRIIDNTSDSDSDDEQPLKFVHRLCNSRKTDKENGEMLACSSTSRVAEDDSNTDIEQHLANGLERNIENTTLEDEDESSTDSEQQVANEFERSIENTELEDEDEYVHHTFTKATRFSIYGQQPHGSFHEEEVSDSDLIRGEEKNNDNAPSVDFMKLEDVNPKFEDSRDLEKFEKEKAIAIKKLKEISEDLERRPFKASLVEHPNYLTVQLKQHQLDGINFMLWREKMKPRGGILADDMGLGKTLTIIALVLKTKLQRKALGGYESGTDSDDDGRDDDRNFTRSSATLVVCLASLVEQWGKEIKERIHGSARFYYLLHKGDKTTSLAQMNATDIVLTSYEQVALDVAGKGILYQVRWNRIVLDEAHFIRTRTSNISDAVCKLHARSGRWIVTGTPIHNSEQDIFPYMKFLRYKPFNELNYWRQFIIAGKSSSDRLRLLLKTVMIRRMKQELMELGVLNEIPTKTIRIIKIVLSAKQREMYNSIMAQSKSIFARYTSQKQRDQNDLTDKLNDTKQIASAHRKLVKSVGVVKPVKTTELLMLLLRLRQACCFNSLVKKLPDGQVLIANDGVGPKKVDSAKMEETMKIVEGILKENSDKIIIVSQWTECLALIGNTLKQHGLTYCEIKGGSKNRNEIVEKFNDSGDGNRIMLLSLAAGGVGLNLTGGNHMIIFDSHWNPQLEAQAQDRIYRLGQTKEVIIYKLICTDTIEENIAKVQEMKLAIAEIALTGTELDLSMNELAELFK